MRVAFFDLEPWQGDYLQRALEPPSHEAVQRILDTTIENLHAYLHGEPQNRVV